MKASFIQQLVTCDFDTFPARTAEDEQTLKERHLVTSTSLEVSAPKSHDRPHCCHHSNERFNVEVYKLQDFLRFKKKHLFKTTNHRGLFQPQAKLCNTWIAIGYTTLLTRLCFQCVFVSHRFFPHENMGFENIGATLSTLLPASGAWLIKSCGQRRGERM